MSLFKVTNANISLANIDSHLMETSHVIPLVKNGYQVCLCAIYIPAFSWNTWNLYSFAINFKTIGNEELSNRDE
jgi:hypothetical protein